MEMKKQNKKAISIHEILNAIIFLCFALMYGIIGMNISGIAQTIFLIFGGIILAIAIIFCFIFPVLQYHNYLYGYDDKRIILKYGVIFKHYIVIPMRQIQDLHEFQGPIMLLAHLSGVIISTAGSNFSITYMSTEDAKQMVKDLESNLNTRLEDTTND